MSHYKPTTNKCLAEWGREKNRLKTKFKLNVKCVNLLLAIRNENAFKSTANHTKEKKIFVLLIN
jgi:hypothetical protein